jgi:hypothetical protein
MISTAKIYLAPIVGFDVMGYSRRSTPDQANVQRIYQDVLERTLRGLAAEKKNNLEYHFLNQGDGGIVALQGDIEIGIRFLSRFGHHLEVANDLLGQARVHMRYALHFGIIRVEEERVDLAVAGDGINVLARLLDGMPHDCPGQAVISDTYKHILTDQAVIGEKHFTEMLNVHDKHGNIHKMWNFRNDNVGILIV